MEMNSSRNEYDKEMNLVEFGFYCLKKWRGILIIMLVVAVFTGAYKYRAVVNDNKVKIELKRKQEEEGIDEETRSVNSRVTSYRFAIQKSEEDLEKRKNFMENSVLMQLDPNHLWTVSISFYIDYQGGEEGKKDALMSAYQNFANDGRLALLLVEEESSITQEELQYLISFNNMANEGLQEERMSRAVRATGQALEYRLVQIQAPVSGQSVFQIQIIALNEELCQIYTDVVRNAFLDYRRKLQNSVADHELQVLGFVQSEQMNVFIQDYQNQALADYMQILKNLVVLKTDLEGVLKTEGEYISVQEAIVLGNPVITGIKFAITGMIIGLVLSLAVLFLVYVTSNKLQNADTFEEEYRVKLLGRVNQPVDEKKWFAFLDSWIYRIEQGAYANISFDEQMRIAASNIKAEAFMNGGLKKVMIAGTIGKNEIESACIQLAEGIEDIIFSEYKQIVFSAADLEELDNYEGIFFLEKRGKSLSKLVHQEKELAESRNVKILGAVIL